MGSLDGPCEVEVYADALRPARVWEDPEPPPVIPGTQRQLLPLPYMVDLEPDDIRAERLDELRDARQPAPELPEERAEARGAEQGLTWTGTAADVAAVAATISHWASGAGTRIYSDGSVRDGRMALGVTVPGAGSVAARLPPGRPSSGAAELVGLMVALHGVPPAGGTVALDNRGVVQRYNQVVAAGFRPRRAARGADLVRWAVLAAMVDDRRERGWAVPSVQWVRGHQDVEGLIGAALVDAAGNQQADRLATSHTGPLVEEVTSYQTAVRWTVFAGDMEVEGHVRRELTSLDRYQAAFEFYFQPRHDYMVAIAGHMDWALTFWMLHDGNFIWGPGTTRGDASRRRYSVQALTRQLPTQGEMWRRRPEVYWNGWCRRCGREPETQEHVWACPAARAAAHQALNLGLQALLEALRDQPPSAQQRLRERWEAAGYLEGDLEGREPP
ncbi:hypothetical protein HK101_006181, partial [Irineochytrium annulatum]